MAVKGRRGSPWARLEVRADIVLRFADLTSTGARGACCRTGDGWLIVLCSTLNQVDRSTVLAHELGHIERGGGCWADGMPPGWGVVVARDERAADRAAALEMVPQDLLRDWLHRQDGGVTALDVAIEWAVSPWLAALALSIAVE
jgi:hypothetical protein